MKLVKALLETPFTTKSPSEHRPVQTSYSQDPFLSRDAKIDPYDQVKIGDKWISVGALLKKLIDKGIPTKKIKEMSIERLVKKAREMRLDKEIESAPTILSTKKRDYSPEIVSRR